MCIAMFFKCSMIKVWIRATFWALYIRSHTEKVFSLGWCLGVWLSVLCDPFLTNDWPYLTDSKMHIFFTFSCLWNQNVSYKQWHFKIPVSQEAVEREMSLPSIFKLGCGYFDIMIYDKNTCPYMPKKTSFGKYKIKILWLWNHYITVYLEVFFLS